MVVHERFLVVYSRAYRDDMEEDKLMRILWSDGRGVRARGNKATSGGDRWSEESVERKGNVLACAASENYCT